MSDLSQLTDQRLVQMVAQGDSAAFEALVVRHRCTFMSAAKKGLRRWDPQAVHDIVQRAQFKLWRAICAKKYDSSRNLASYAWKIAYREGISWKRREAAFRKHHLLGLEQNGPGVENFRRSQLDPGLGWIKRIIHDGRMDHVRAALNRIPAKYATALKRRYMDGMDCGEIAAELKLTVTQVYQLLARARERFKSAWLELSGEDEGDGSAAS